MPSPFSSATPTNGGPSVPPWSALPWQEAQCSANATREGSRASRVAIHHAAPPRPTPRVAASAIPTFHHQRIWTPAIPRHPYHSTGGAEAPVSPGLGRGAAGSTRMDSALAASGTRRPMRPGRRPSLSRAGSAPIAVRERSQAWPFVALGSLEILRNMVLKLWSDWR